MYIESSAGAQNLRSQLQKGSLDVMEAEWRDFCTLLEVKPFQNRLQTPLQPLLSCIRISPISAPA